MKSQDTKCVANHESKSLFHVALSAVRLPYGVPQVGALKPSAGDLADVCKPNDCPGLAVTDEVTLVVRL